jgi:TrmH family RNA methyltransferase
MPPAYRPYRREDPHGYASGVFPCLELLASGRPVLAVVLPGGPEDNAGLDRIAAQAAARAIPVIRGDRLLARLGGKESCRAVGVFAKGDDVLDPAADHLVLQGPADAGNLGTILRTALGFGVRDLAILGDAVDHEQPKVVRASMGARFHLRVRRYPDGAAYRAAHPRPCYAFTGAGAVDLRELAPARPCALVFGNEARGLDPTWAASATTVRIVHGDAIDSLNLAVAVAIGLFAVTGRRPSARPDLT